MHFVTRVENLQKGPDFSLISKHALTILSHEFQLLNLYKPPNLMTMLMTMFQN